MRESAADIGSAVKLYLLLGWLLIGLLSTASTAGAQLLSEDDKAFYRAAFERAESGDYRGARALAAQASDPLPGKVITWLELTRGTDSVDFINAYGFLVANPDWPDQPAIQRRAEATLPATLPDIEILAWFNTRPPVTIDGAMRYAATLLRVGQAERAGKLLRETWVNKTFTAAEERQFRGLFSRYLTPEAEIARLDRLLWSRQGTAARRQASRMSEGHRALAEARLRLSAMRPGVDAAIRRVPELLRDDPGLVLERALWRRRMDLHGGVVELLQRPGSVSRSEVWWRLRDWAARRALAKGDAELAYRVAAQHGLASGIGFAQGEWLAGWIALRHLGHPATAYQHFTRLFEGVSTPVSRARGAYWAGRAAEASENHRLAKTWYEASAEHATTYYGQFAVDRLDIELELPTATVRPSKGERLAFDTNELVRLSRMLAEVGRDDLAAVFAQQAGRTMRSAGETRLFFELAQSIGRPDLALAAARQARELGIMLMGELYPVYPTSIGGGLDPAIVLALIRQESGFYPRAVSPSGARGLMQLMPDTARMVAGNLALRYSMGLLTADPAYNLRLGQAYLRHLQDRFGGSDPLTLAAYNAGPTKVTRWIDEFGDPRDGGVDPIDWIETIPLEETRNYVQRILESVVVYRHILTQAEAALDPASDTTGAGSSAPASPQSLLLPFEDEGGSLGDIYATAGGETG